MGRATPASGPTVHPRLTSELPGARCRRHTCSQPARLEPSSRKLSCNPRTPPSSVRKRRGVLTRVGGRVAPFPPHPQSRGARPSHPCPYLRRGGPGAPAGRAGRAARAGTAGPCSAPGRAASAGARARPGPAGGSGGGSACCRLAGVWGGERAERGCRAPGVPPTAGTGSPGEGGNPGDREPRRPSGAGSREQGEGPELAARPRSRPRRYSPVARHSCKQRDGGERGAARRPPPRFPPPPPAPPRCSRSWRRPGGG